jgi:magnesium transporter
MIRKRGGWLAILFMWEMLTASAMQHFEPELAKAVVLALFIPLIISSGGNSGSQATSLLIRALALQEVRLRDWWQIILRELPTGITLGVLLGLIGMGRIALWQLAGFYNYGEHWTLIALTIGTALVGVVTFGSLAGAMLPLVMHAIKFDPATASARSSRHSSTFQESLFTSASPSRCCGAHSCDHDRSSTPAGRQRRWARLSFASPHRTHR